ncbi:hypothetical protein V1477_002555 [Vespula maculifrons]|uniref:Uncharacterized protein n=1 Tax=Vespula maculifrons TaxID=7453 RepID=A0ABD2CWY3_VESMC
MRTDDRSIAGVRERTAPRSVNPIGRKRREKRGSEREASSRVFEPDRVADSRPETILVERFAAAIGGKSRATPMEGGSGVEDGEEVCMNFNRHLIWYTSELRVPLNRDQVDLHGEDNTRCTLPARTDNTLSEPSREASIALLSVTLHLPSV